MMTTMNIIVATLYIYYLIQTVAIAVLMTITVLVITSYRRYCEMKTMGMMICLLSCSE